MISRPPRWKEVEASEQFAGLTDDKREIVRSRWVTKVHRYMRSRYGDRYSPSMLMSLIDRSGLARGTASDIQSVADSAPEFDAESDGYDYDSAVKAGLGPDETGHWPSRDPVTGLLLKGTNHPARSKTVDAEKQLGMEIYTKNGRYYSRQADSDDDVLLSGVDPEMYTSGVNSETVMQRLQKILNPKTEKELDTIDRILKNMPEGLQRELAQSIFPLEEERVQLPKEYYRDMGAIGFFENYGRGAQEWEKHLPVVGDVIEAADLANVVLRYRRVQADDYRGGPLGEAQKRQDLRVLANFAEKDRELRARGKSLMASIGSGIANSTKAAVEAALTSGTSGAVKAGREMTEAALKRELMSALKYGLAAGRKLAKETAVQSAKLAVTRGPLLTLQEMLPGGVEVDEDTGRVRVGKEGKSLAMAIVHAALRNYGQELADRAGDAVIDPVTTIGKKLTAKAFAKIPARAKIGARFVQGLREAWRKAGKSDSALAAAMKTGSLDSILQELGEERLEDVYMAALSEIPGIELGKWEDVKYGKKGERLKNFATELGVTLGMKGGRAVMKAAGAAGKNIQELSRDMESAGEAGIEAMAEVVPEGGQTPPEGTRPVPGQTPSEGTRPVPGETPLKPDEIARLQELLKQSRKDEQGRPVLSDGTTTVYPVGVSPRGLRVARTQDGQDRGTMIPPSVLRQRLGMEPEAGAEGGLPVVPSAATFSVDTVRDPGKKATGRWAVVERADIADRMKSGREKGYQPRDRSRKAAQEQNGEIRGRFQPSYLGDSPVADRGSMVVTRNGEILAGYGRFGVLSDIYDENAESAQKYREFVTEQAEQLGLNRQLRGMQEPVLVRVAENFENTDAAEFATLSNDRVTLGMSQAEDALKDGRMIIDSGMIDALDLPESGDMASMQNRAFWNRFVDDAGIGAEMLKKDGSPTPELAERMERAVFAAMLSESESAQDTVTELFENNTDRKLGDLQKDVVNSAPELLKLRKNKQQFDLVPVLSKVVPEMVRARQAVRDGTVKTEAEYFDQLELFGTDPEVREMAQMLLEDSPAEVAEILSRYADTADGIDTKTGMLLDEEVIGESTILSILRGVRENVTGKPAGTAVAEAAGTETRKRRTEVRPEPGRETEPGQPAEGPAEGSQGGEEYDRVGLEHPSSTRAEKPGKLHVGRIPAAPEVFTMLGIPEGRISADYEWLQREHSQHFDTPEEARDAVEYVLARPEIATEENDGLGGLIRTLPGIRKVFRHPKIKIRLVKRGGSYQVRSVHLISDDQLSRDKKSRQRSGVSTLIPDSSVNGYEHPDVKSTQ